MSVKDLCCICASSLESKWHIYHGSLFTVKDQCCNCPSCRESKWCFCLRSLYYCQWSVLYLCVVSLRPAWIKLTLLPWITVHCEWSVLYLCIMKVVIHTYVFKPTKRLPWNLIIIAVEFSFLLIFPYYFEFSRISCRPLSTDKICTYLSVFFVKMKSKWK